MSLFSDRREAGRLLATALAHLAAEHPVVVGLPRGGVPVAEEVATALGAPLDVILVRKVGVPFQPELAMGAIGEQGVRVVNRETMMAARVSQGDFERVERREQKELARRGDLYRGGRDPIPLEGRTVIVVDDGLATGSTAEAALRVARAHGAGRVVLAVPVAPPDTVQRLMAVADEIVCPYQPPAFGAVGTFYDDFSPTTDDEVIRILSTSAPAGADRRPQSGSLLPGGRLSPIGPADAEVQIEVGGVRLGGHLVVPERAGGLVVFAHGSGSSRHSPRNQSVARTLEQAGLGTLLFDLLVEEEADDRRNVFDVDLLAGRLLGATSWVLEHEATAGLPLGYFGASTGAAAALWAAAEPGNPVSAVVSRGGRPDLAVERLGHVRAPTLLIVGGLDRAVLDLNRAAAARMRCHNELAIVPGASHLFEEPGTLAAAAGLARDWFMDHLASGGSGTRPAAGTRRGTGQPGRWGRQSRRTRSA